MDNKITINDLLGNSAKIEKAANETLTVKLVELDKEIEIHKISKSDFLDMIDDKSGTPTDNIAIYEACPIFKDSQLIEKLGCKSNPYGVIEKCLSTKTIYALAKRIMAFSDLDLSETDNLVKDVVTDVKN